MCKVFVVANILDVEATMESGGRSKALHYGALDSVAEFAANFLHTTENLQWKIVSDKTYLEMESCSGSRLFVFANYNLDWVAMTPSEIEEAKLKIFAGLDL